MHSLQKTAIGLHRIALSPKVRRAISSLDGEKSAIRKAVSTALNQTIRNDITSEEMPWIERIESLRRELSSSRERISIVDYGAGSTDGTKDETIHQGRIVVRTIGEVCRRASKSYFWSLLLFKLIRGTEPSVCLELGTCFGISASYEAAALKLNQHGKLVTLEGAESLASLAARSLEVLGLENVDLVIGKFQQTLDGVLNEHSPIDFAFLDGHHDGQATVAYFEQILPFLSESALLVFDDIRWSKSMRGAWKTIRSDARIDISLDLWTIGICVIDGSKG